MIVTIRDREIAESAWDAAAAEMANEHDDHNVAEYLYANNPWRAEGTRYCITCGEATTKHTMDRAACGSCGDPY